MQWSPALCCTGQRRPGSKTGRHSPIVATTVHMIALPNTVTLSPPPPPPPPRSALVVQVNLLPQERPEDPYHGVAMRVEEMRKRDAETGHGLAMVLEGKIHRKVVFLWCCNTVTVYSIA